MKRKTLLDVSTRQNKNSVVAAKAVNITFPTKQHDLIEIKGKKLTTTSLIVAEKFGKRHDNVIQKIDNLIKMNTKDVLNFKERNYSDIYSRKLRMYEMDRKAFTLLVMSFQGAKAFEWQCKFYDAFEAMEKKLLQQQNASWQNARLEGKQDRLELTDSIKKLSELAKKNDSRNSNRYYTNITNMIYKKLFNINKVPPGFRDTLGKNELRQLQLVEWKMSVWLDESLKNCDDYHVPYYEIKKKLESLIDVIGTINLDMQSAIPAGLISPLLIGRI